MNERGDEGNHRGWYGPARWPRTATATAAGSPRLDPEEERAAPSEELGVARTPEEAADLSAYLRNHGPAHWTVGVEAAGPAPAGVRRRPEATARVVVHLPEEFTAQEVTVARIFCRQMTANWARERARTGKSAPRPRRALSPAAPAGGAARVIAAPPKKRAKTGAGTGAPRRRA